MTVSHHRDEPTRSWTEWEGALVVCTYNGQANIAEDL